MSGLIVPSGYRQDIFLRVNFDGPTLLPQLRALAKCWAGSETAIGHVVRVWDHHTWPGNVATPESWSALIANLGTTDLLAIPVAWGDPPTGSSCWSDFGPTGFVVGDVNVKPDGKSYSFVSKFTGPAYVTKGGAQVVKLATQTKFAKGSSPLDPAFAKYLAALGQTGLEQVADAFDAAFTDQAKATALFDAGAQCPQAVLTAVQAGKLAQVTATSTAESLCADLSAAGLGPKPSNPGMSTGEKVAIGVVVLGVAAAIYEAMKKKRRR